MALIPIPGGNPQDIVLHPGGDYLYLSDAHLPQIFRLDIAPKSDSFHTFTSIPLNDVAQAVPLGIRQMAVTNDGTQLLAVAPNRNSASDLMPTGGSSQGNIVVVDLTTRRQSAVKVGDFPFANSATSDTNKIVFTNFLGDADRQGFGVLERTNGVWRIDGDYVDLHLGIDSDSFDINNASGVAITAGQKCAFVLGYNVPDFQIPSHAHGEEILSDYAAGSSAGIIYMPLDPSARQLVAMMEPVPNGFLFDFDLWWDDSLLTVAFNGTQQIVVGALHQFVATYNIASLRKVAESSANWDELKTKPIEMLAPTSVDASSPGTGLWGVASQTSHLTVEATGKLGDVVKVDLKNLLTARLGSHAFKDFDLNLTSIVGGDVATYDNERIVQNDTRRNAAGTFVSDDFSYFGIFYFVPDVRSAQLGRNKMQSSQGQVAVTFNGTTLSLQSRSKYTWMLAGMTPWDNQSRTVLGSCNLNTPALNCQDRLAKTETIIR